jgi:hypothetical protein
MIDSKRKRGPRRAPSNCSNIVGVPCPRWGYDPQIAYAWTDTAPVPVVVVTTVAVQPVGVPLVTFGAETAIAPRCEPPCVTVAPPPRSFAPPVQVAVLAVELVPTGEALPTVVVVPATTVVDPITPVGPVGPAPVGPVGPAPVGPVGPVVPAPV